MNPNFSRGRTIAGMGMRSDLSGGISLRFTAAMARARELVERPRVGRPAPPPRPGKRLRVVGDPQAPLETFLQILDAHELLGVDGFLADDVVLISIGDHFDYGAHDDTDPRHDGLAVLRWLAEHDPQQAPILLGNHDVVRVQELIGLTDARFARARALGGQLVELHRSDPDAASRRYGDEWCTEFPDVPTPSLAARDYAAWTEAQRALMIELLLAGRFRLAVPAVLADGRDALITHAGVTSREVELIGCETAAGAIAAALDGHLARAVAARTADWHAGRMVPLGLQPLHYPGAQPDEGGGLLYHRPANPAREGADQVWETDRRRRRFHPHELPRGLVQVAGHTTHKKARHELQPWLSDAATALTRGGLRTLLVDGDRVLYDAGITGIGGAVAVLHLVDAEMNERGKDPEDYPLLELAAISG